MFRIPAHLQRNPQSGVFYFRLTVPERLRHIVGKREFKKSLGTGKRSEAVMLAQKHYYASKLLLLKAEATMTKKKDFIPYSKEWIKQNAELGRIGDDSKPEPPRDDIDQVLDDIMETIAARKAAMQSESESMSMQKITVPIMYANGVTRDAVFDFGGDVEKELQAAAGMQELANKVDVPERAFSKPSKEGKTVHLAGMVRAYLQEMKRVKAWTEKTYDENKSIYQLLREILENPAVSTISFDDGRKFKETLLKLPPNRTKGKYAGNSVKELISMRPSKTMSNSTVNKYLRRTSQLFHWGRKNGHVAENPFAELGLKDSRQEHEERNRYDYEDIKKLFNPESFNSSKFKHPYNYWLPILGLYTGARLEELCQLHASDVYQSGDIWVIDINNKMEKRLKTKSSKRLIPLHPKVVELGFIGFVQSKPAGPGCRVFPELKKQRDGYGQAASKWFARYQTKCGIGKPLP